MAVNNIAEAYMAECRLKGHTAPTWRMDYGAGELILGPSGIFGKANVTLTRRLKEGSILILIWWPLD